MLVHSRRLFFCRYRFMPMTPDGEVANYSCLSCRNEVALFWDWPVGRKIGMDSPAISNMVVLSYISGCAVCRFLMDKWLATREIIHAMDSGVI